MTQRQLTHIRALEGRRVSLALADGSRVDDCQLISSGRPGTATVWVFANGTDHFFRRDHIVDCWES